MIHEHDGVSMRTAALVAGFPLMFFFAPYGEFYVFAKLVSYSDGARTTQNIVEHPQLFLSGVFSMLIVFIYDVILAWAMYIFVRPVNPLLSLLGAWIRVVYAVLAITALFNFMYAFYVANLAALDVAVKQQQVLQLVNARRFGMFLAYFVFGGYLIYGGLLMLRATYIPKWLSVSIALAGLAYMINFSLQPLFFKAYDFSWMMLFSIAELVLAIWLLVKGRKVNLIK